MSAHDVRERDHQVAVTIRWRGLWPLPYSVGQLIARTVTGILQTAGIFAQIDIQSSVYVDKVGEDGA